MYSEIPKVILYIAMEEIDKAVANDGKSAAEKVKRVKRILKVLEEYHRKATAARNRT